MARDFDPDNLTAGDVFKTVAPIFGVIGVLYLINKYFPDFVGLVVVALIVLVMVYVWTLPRKDLRAMAEADRKTDERIEGVAVVGPGLRLLRQAFDWLSTIVGAIMFIWLVYWAIGKAF